MYVLPPPPPTPRVYSSAWKFLVVTCPVCRTVRLLPHCDMYVSGVAVCVRRPPLFTAGWSRNKRFWVAAHRGGGVVGAAFAVPCRVRGRIARTRCVALEMQMCSLRHHRGIACQTLSYRCFARYLASLCWCFLHVGVIAAASERERATRIL